MSRDNDDAVLRAIGQIMCKMDYDEPADIKLILRMITQSAGFNESVYGKKYIDILNSRLKRLKDKESESDTARFDDLLRHSDEKNEKLIQTIDESLFQVASQTTSRNIQKLVWVVLAFSVINAVAVLFVALFLWKLNMG